ncbi:S-adenosyl-L-homocysteine hydrolase [Thermosipho africanus Ob7]|jgi:adenosylhomocysteinase|uniref:adenosylhomocysteinase n=1 Tax=Thermosipho africanus TaxID=2421 RepID=UPI000E0C2D8B|nr:adenosylhomocysteinase [Thermosipho africanus]MDK2900520.1 adenosylhomocysteinase [Thermosipho sp. (in: thermotogales)]RDI92879.1 S-adenosyl-L-homocysteine hydrolase [Thermosipho africanus Ob7]
MESGRKKIEWVSNFMPLLNYLKKEYKGVFNSTKIGMAIHLEAKTAYLAITLKELGADVFVTGCNPLSTQDDVAAALSEYGITVHAKRTHDEKIYFKNLNKVLDHEPELILDDGADLSVILHTERTELLKNVKGISEETTTGVRRLLNLQENGLLKVPVIAVNNAKMKHFFDNRYGTGQSTWDSIMRNTNTLIAGKNVVVAGYGWCGRGIAMRAKGLGANVIVTEVDPIKAIEALMDGFNVMKMSEAAKIADIVVTSTGVKDVVKYEDILNMKNGVILANAGHFNVEIPIEKIEKNAEKIFEARENVKGYIINGKKIFVIGEGRLVNLAAGDGHPIEIMDLSFALQTLSLIYIHKNYKNLENKVYQYPEELDEKVATLKLKSLGIEIDKLSEEQREYLKGY